MGQIKTLLGWAALAAMMLPTSGHAAILTDSYDDWAAHAGTKFNNTDTLGPEYSALPSVHLKGGGSFAAKDFYTGESVGSVYTIGSVWGMWSGSYGGQVLYSDDSNAVTLSFSGLSAFGLEVQPLSTDGMYLVTATLSSGETLTDNVSGFAGAQFFGIYGGQLTSLTISTEDNAFAFGNFVSVPSVSTVPLPGSAPLFGLALVALGALRFVLKGRTRTGQQVGTDPHAWPSGSAAH